MGGEGREWSTKRGHGGGEIAKVGGWEREKTGQGGGGGGGG